MHAVINTYGPPPMAHRIRIDRPYTPSFATNIRETFERERDRLTRTAFAELHGNFEHLTVRPRGAGRYGPGRYDALFSPRGPK